MPEKFTTVKEDVADLRLDFEVVRHHVETMNSELGELRDEQRKQNEMITFIRVDLADVKADLSWLKRTYWIIATATVGALATGILNLLERR